MRGNKTWHPTDGDARRAAALCTLGCKYAKGEGVQRDQRRAVELFTAAAEQGNAG